MLWFEDNPGAMVWLVEYYLYSSDILLTMPLLFDLFAFAIKRVYIVSSFIYILTYAETGITNAPRLINLVPHYSNGNQYSLQF